MGIVGLYKFPLVLEFDAVVSMELSCCPEGLMVSLAIFFCSLFFFLQV